MNNNRGFTLVELLATITILGIIMLLAVPNILGTVERNKKTTYIEDAKKLVSLAENKIRSNTRLVKPTTGCGIVYTLKELDNGSLSEPPEGGKYDEDLSFVAVTYANGDNGEGYKDEYVYRVQLFENVEKGDKGTLQRGIKLTYSKKLKQDDIELAEEGWEMNPYSVIGGEANKCKVEGT